MRHTFKQASETLMISALGMFALGSQTLLFRHFLTVHEGNELSIGTFFCAWLLWVALGALAARLFTRSGRLVRNFELLALLYVPAFLIQQYFLLNARNLAGIPAYEMFPFVRMFPITFIGNAPVSFATGFLFTAACQWTRPSGLPVARVYVAESAGAFLGGIITTVLLSHGSAEEHVFIILAGILTGVVGLRAFSSRGRLLLRVSAIVLMISWAFILLWHADRIWTTHNDRIAWKRLLPQGALYGRFTTSQARYLYGVYGNQFNIVAWESISETIPNSPHGATVAAVTLSQNPHARRILVIGPGSYAVCRAFLQLPQVQSVTWLHPDPEYPRRLLKVLPARFAPDQARLRLPEQDPRVFLEHSRNSWDLVILNMPDPTTLVLNRFFTRAFFRLVASHLAQGGVLAVRSSGGENVMGGELVNIGASLMVTLETVFPHLAIKPGDETWFLASPDPILSESATELERRLLSIPDFSNIFPPEGIRSLYIPDRIAFQKHKYRTAAENMPRMLLLNTRNRPKAMLHTLLFITRHAGSRFSFSRTVVTAYRSTLAILLLLALLYTLLRLTYILKTFRPPENPGKPRMSSPVDAHSLVLSSGAVSMGAGIILMFMFQAAHGSLFLYVGLLNSILMLGFAIGGRITERLVADRGQSVGGLSAGIVALHVCLLALMTQTGPTAPFLRFMLLFLALGIIGGTYTPLAAAMCRRAGLNAGRTGSLVEFNDHLGGAVGAVLVSLCLLPIYGSAPAVFAIGAMLISNIPLALARHLRTDSLRIASKDQRLRVAGYLLFGIAAAAIGTSTIVHRNLPSPVRLRQVARTLVPGCTLQAAQITGRTLTLPVIRFHDPRGGPSGYVFQTDQLCADVQGYAGPVVLALAVDEKGHLLDFRVIESHETPDYLSPALKWAKHLCGRNIFVEPSERLAALSGATITSRAIADTIRLAGLRFAALIGAGKPVGTGAPHSTPHTGAYVLAAFILTILLVRLHPTPMLRRIYLIVVLIVFGILLNAQYSTDQVFQILSLHPPAPGATIQFILVCAVPLLVMLLGNFYCGWLCPFGALQELAAEFVPSFLWPLPRLDTWARARLIKYIILFLALLLFAVTAARNVLPGDILVNAFTKHMLPVIAIIVIVALVFPRFWCRCLCPAGAFLALLGSLRLLRRFLPRVQPSRCPYGVRNRAEMDCLQCDRCRMPHSLPVPRNDRSHPIADGMLLAAALTGALLVFLPSLGRLQPPTSIPASAEPAPQGTVIRAGISSALRGHARQVDLRRLRNMIRDGRLSDHEAKFYTVIGGRSEHLRPGVLTNTAPGETAETK